MVDAPGQPDNDVTVADGGLGLDTTSVYRSALSVRKVELAAQLRQLRGDIAEMVEASRDVNLDDEHDPEGSTIAFERTQLMHFANDAVRGMAEVDEALIRLADGRYGYCCRCGAAIGAERLAARPTAVLCIRCADAGPSKPTLR